MLYLKNLFIYFFFSALLFSSVSCKNESPLENNTPSTDDKPAITEDIPFATLGHGKIAFKRMGPENKWSKIFIVDVDKQSSWTLDISPLSGDPCISPDGKKITFSMYSGWNSGTAWDVHVAEIDGSNVQNISHIEGQDKYPSWSPDGAQIIFWEMIGLYMQSPVENPPDQRKIKYPENPYGLITVSGRLSISISGRIAFVTQSPSARLITMDKYGNSKKVFVTAPDSSALESPVFSPDGQHIAFMKIDYQITSHPEKGYIGKIGKALQICLISLNTDSINQTILVDEKLHGEWLNSGLNSSTGNSLCWSPDGSKILFTKPEGDYKSYIYVVNADGSGLTKVTSAEDVVDIDVSWGR